MTHRRQVWTLTFIVIIAFSLPTLLSQVELFPRIDVDYGNTDPPHETLLELAADPGIPMEGSSFIVVELPSSSIPSRGQYWADIVISYGLPTSVVTFAEAEADSSIFHESLGIIIDASIGSDSASHVTDAFLQNLLSADAPVILTGRAAWLLHLLRVRGPPSLTALSSNNLLTTPGYEGAVFLSNPLLLSIGSPLTTEFPVSLPKDPVQSERSRLVDLTGRDSPSHIASLRYESWPLDTFLFSPEDPALLTADGKGLLVNTLAYSLAHRENSISLLLEQTQSPADSTLPGGFAYFHEPTVSAAYSSVQAFKSLLDSSEWTAWKASHSSAVNDILQSLLADFGSESGFMTSTIDQIVNCKSTAQGLWLASAMGITESFPIAEIVAYLSSRQDVNGAFQNHITTTFHVIEALNYSGNLGYIDMGLAENWLRSCVIDGGKTSNPDLWGAIAADATSLTPTNEYATHYVLALDCLGTSHNDPVKLTQWITSRTSNGDGSYNNSLSLSEELTIGTTSAISTMSVLGTLSAENKTSTMNWLTANQQQSGGFGLKEKSDDIVAKTKESHAASRCLNLIGETSSNIAQGLVSYFSSVESNVGFELMEPIPSLMWSYWMSSISRLVHATGIVDTDASIDYLSYFSQWTQYPFWNNLTTFVSPEYGPNQYRTKSVWTQLFGIGIANALGVVPAPGVVSDAVAYIAQSQYVLGHFRPALFSGTAHMQHSVAALEALYLLDSLDAVYYKSALESAVIAEYSSGSWSGLGWTLRPFAGQQSAIDWLCTRAAVRLGLVDATMASEIATVIEARLQYTDLWALSRDAATLALLNASGFSVDLESIDRNQVLDELASSSFTNGWYSDSVLYQPIFTEGVLELMSILGLKPQLFATLGSSMIASAASEVALADVLAISVGISAPGSSHVVVLHAFGTCMKYNNVANTDVLLLQIPGGVDNLGPELIYLQLDDWGVTKAFDMVQVTVTSELQGNLVIDTPTVTVGEFVNGTIFWTLGTGGSVDLANITVRLEDITEYQQWTYESSSPFDLMIPTADFGAGICDVVVIVQHAYCDDLILQDEILIVAPEPTYILSQSAINGDVDTPLPIPWSLHLVANDSEVISQQISLTILDDSRQVVHVDADYSVEGGNAFLWTPSQRGSYTFSLLFEGNGSLTQSEYTGVIEVYEDTQMLWIGIGQHDQYTAGDASGQLATVSGTPVAGEIVHVVVTSPSSSIVMDAYLMTNSSGHIQVVISFDENGVYTLDWTFAASGSLEASSGSETITSWSASQLQAGGIGSEDVGQTWNVWSLLLDSASNPVPEESVTLRIILLPSTVVFEQTLTTNSSGYVSAQWTGSSAGSYQLEGEFIATAFRGASIDISPFDLRVPVTLTLDFGQDLKVGVGSWIQITARDHTGSPISGLTVTVTVRTPGGQIAHSDSGSTINGLLYLSWTPSVRGLNNVTALSSRQSWYQEADVTELVGVSETPDIVMNLIGVLEAPSFPDLSITVYEQSGAPIEGVVVQIQVLLNGGVILDVSEVTSTEGLIILALALTEPGTISIGVVVPSQGWILTSSISYDAMVLGTTSLQLTTPGQPVEQGSPIAILATLRNWNGLPLEGAQIVFTIEWANGTTLTISSKTTGENGICTMAYDFDMVGDFIIRASYSGQSLNSPTSASAFQRIYATPTIEILHSPSCIVGESLEIGLGLQDALGARVSGRTLLITIRMNAVIVFEAQILTSFDLESLHWSPSERGLVSIDVLHAGDVYYYASSIHSTTSALEQITATLSAMPNTIDLYGTTIMRYTLTSANLDGVEVILEVLGVDLIPLWSVIVTTNTSGIAEAAYVASQSHGILTLQATPTANQFLIGGTVQNQLTVMTECDVSLALEPQPPCVGMDTNISILVLDELGIPLDGISVTVSLFDPLGEQVKLGVWLNSVTLQVVDGIAKVSFIPEMPGLYTIGATSSGSVTVHGFTETGLHTVYQTTTVAILLSDSELDVGEDITVDVLLLDSSGNPMVGRNITLVLDGPGPSIIGPIDLLTNDTGYASYTTSVNEEGLWLLEAEFSGLGVYLSASDSVPINVLYGTMIDVSVLAGSGIAGQTDVSLAVLLTDSGGTPLEGFTIQYDAYHDLYGLLLEGSIIQQGQEPITLNISLDLMGIYTILLTFPGTTHYRSSLAAEEVTIFGTVDVSFEFPCVLDRSDDAAIIIAILDEQSQVIPMDQVQAAIELLGPEGIIDIADRLTISATLIEIELGGLPVGSYTANVLVDDSPMRIGTSGSCQFAVTAETSLYLLQEELPGILSERHKFVFVLEDSLNELLSGETVYVSIYNPEDREVYGSPLTERTALQVSSEGTEVLWRPSLVGEYVIVLTFDGTDFLNATSLEIRLLVRYPSIIDVSSAERAQFGESVPLSISLTGGLTKLTGMDITVLIALDGSTQQQLTVTTGSFGRVDFSVTGLLAGNHSLTVQFAGTDVYAPSSASLNVMVEPLITFDLIALTPLHTQSECSISLRVKVLGVDGDWNSTLDVQVLSPVGTLLGSIAVQLTSDTTEIIRFAADEAGTYYVNCTVYDLPVLGQVSHLMAMNVVYPPILMQLDAGTTPVIGGVGVLLLIGAVFWKKMDSLMSSIPTDWSS